MKLQKEAFWQTPNSSTESVTVSVARPPHQAPPAAPPHHTKTDEWRPAAPLSCLGGFSGIFFDTAVIILLKAPIHVRPADPHVFM